MEDLHAVSAPVVRPQSKRPIQEEIIPESFPTWRAFLKVVGMGLGITVAEYGFLILLIARHR